MKMNHLRLPAGGHLGRVYGSCHTDDRVRIQISSMSRYFTVLAHRSTPSISRCVDILFVYYTGTDLDTHACDENNIYYLERTGDNTIGRAQTSIYSTQRRFGGDHTSMAAMSRPGRADTNKACWSSAWEAPRPSEGSGKLKCLKTSISESGGASSCQRTPNRIVLV